MIGWTIIIAFITLRLYRGDIRRTTQPDDWDLPYVWEICGDLLVVMILSYVVNVFLQPFVGSLV